MQVSVPNVFDKDLLFTHVMPAMLSLAIELLLIGTIVGVDNLWRLTTSCKPEIQTLIVLFLFARFSVSAMVLSCRHATIMLSPNLIEPEQAGRWSTLYELNDHYQGYPERRYGMDSEVFWKRLLLIVPTEVRLSLENGMRSVIKSSQFERVFKYYFRVTCALLSALGVNLYASGNHYWGFVVVGLSAAVFWLEEYLNPLRLPWHDGISACLVAFSRIVFDFRPICSFLISTIAFAALIQFCLGWNELYSHSALHWQSLLHIHEFRIGWARILSCALVCITLLILAVVSYSLLGCYVMSLGAQICSVYDLFRSDLQKKLGVDLTSIPAEQAQWKELGKFLACGSMMETQAQGTPRSLTRFSTDLEPEQESEKTENSTNQVSPRETLKDHIRLFIGSMASLRRIILAPERFWQHNRAMKSDFYLSAHSKSAARRWRDGLELEKEYRKYVNGTSHTDDSEAVVSTPSKVPQSK